MECLRDGTRDSLAIRMPNTLRADSPAIIHQPSAELPSSVPMVYTYGKTTAPRLPSVSTSPSAVAKSLLETSSGYSEGETLAGDRYIMPKSPIKLRTTHNSTLLTSGISASSTTSTTAGIHRVDKNFLERSA